MSEATEFNLFDKLPREIQLKIWKHAVIGLDVFSTLLPVEIHFCSEPPDEFPDWIDYNMTIEGPSLATCGCGKYHIKFTAEFNMVRLLYACKDSNKTLHEVVGGPLTSLPALGTDSGIRYNSAVTAPYISDPNWLPSVIRKGFYAVRDDPTFFCNDTFLFKGIKKLAFNVDCFPTTNSNFPVISWRVRSFWAFMLFVVFADVEEFVLVLRSGDADHDLNGSRVGILQAVFQTIVVDKQRLSQSLGLPVRADPVLAFLYL